MGINPTPTNHRSFTFDGKSTREFGVYTTGKDVFNSPERAVEMISIPGRDGEYALDQGHFNNIEVTYRAGIVSDSTTDFAEAISNFRNWLASRKGYCRLTDEYNTEEYRMAVFKNAIALEHEGLLTGEFDVTFDCKPQRYLAIGEELVEIGAWGNTETAEGEVVTIEASSDTAVKALTADIDPIQDLHGYDAPWVGGAGKNKLQQSWTSPLTHNGVTFTRNSDGSVTATGATSDSADAQCSITFSLPVGNYYFTGCATGGSQSATNTWNVYMWNQTAGARIKKWDGTTNSDTCTNNTQFYQINIHNTTDSYRYTLRVMKNTTLPTGGITFYPMICASTESDATFAPYENICPISGHDEVGVEHTGKNLCNMEWRNQTPSISSGAMVSYNSWNTDFILIDNSKEYVVTVNVSGNIGDYVLFYDADKTYLGYTVISVGSAVRLSQSQHLAQSKYIKIRCDGSSGVNPEAQLELGSTATEYEPYNGQTYTTTLPSTTYGGTLDVVSGVLTVDRVGQTISGGVSLYGNYGVDNKPLFYFDLSTAIVPYASLNAPLSAKPISNKYSAIDTYAVTEMGNGQFRTKDTEEPTTTRIYIRDDRFTTANQINADLATTPLTIIGKLATPTTVQLTGQQIALLLGENNIFADSGNVTVEYGHNPTILTNPTWFPSKPLLAVDGYGEIKFNNRSIANIENATIGKVIVFNGFSRSVAEMPYTSSLTLTLDTSALEASDEIVVDGIRETITFTYPTNIVSVATTTATGMTETHSYSGKVATFNTNIDAETIEYGTSKTWSAHLVASIVSNSGSTTSTPSTFLDFSYDGAQTITVTFRQRSSGSSSSFSVPSLNGTSTRSIITDTIHIDCDIGEAYMIQDGAPVSLNQHIDLGSDLPTLQSGDTEVTYDNTITKVEVQPNWWKV